MSIKVKNLDQVTKKLQKFGNESKRVVINELDEAASNILIAATNRAPTYLCRDSKAVLSIKQRLDRDVKNGGLTVIVGLQGKTDLDAYVEFGTGQDFIDLVTAKPKEYTPEIQELAYNFFKTGEGTLRGTPYLFPSFFEESPKLIARLKKNLKY